MKLLRVLLIPIAAYAGLVALFETWLGIAQPANEATITITTTNGQGIEKRRVLTRLESNGQLYVSANHWPRSWYREAIRHPRVTVGVDGEVRSYRAIEVEGAEAERINAEQPHSIGFRILTGFPPRRFVRLAPNAERSG